MSFDDKALHDLCLLERPVLVSLPDGCKVQVTYFGKLRLNDCIELNHVLLVLHLKYNLLSVKRLTHQLHCTVVFSKDFCTLQGPSLKRPLDIGRETFGLYILDSSLLKVVKFDDFCLLAMYLSQRFVSSTNHEVLCNQASKRLSFDTCHKRFGYIPLKRLGLVTYLLRD